MKKLIGLFTGSKERSMCLSAFLKMEFKEELVSLNMPHVGNYPSGSRTKVTVKEQTREAWHYQS